MITPRFAINAYAIGGVVFLLVGGGLLVLSRAVPLTDFVTLPMGALFLLIGLVWTIGMGRRGRLRDPRGLAESGHRTTARLADATATRSVSRSGEYGPVVSQVFRLDLELVHPARGPVTVRVHRSLRGHQAFAAVTGAELPVAVDPSNPRRIAILWDEAPAGPVADQLAAQVVRALGQQGVQPGVGAAPGAVGSAFTGTLGGGLGTGATVSGRLAGATPVGQGADGAPVLQVVVETTGPQGSRFAQGVVGGPAGRQPSVGDTVTAQLDPSGTVVLSVSW